MGIILIQFNRKIWGFLIVSSSLVLSSLTVGLGVHYGYSVKQNAWLLLNTSGSGPRDQKLIIFVDVPSSGGVPLRYFMYEFSSRGLVDNWYFYTDNKNSNPRSIANPNEFDFIIILASDSNGNGNWDDFNVIITLFSENNQHSSGKYSFGDDFGNTQKIGVWQISTNEVFALANNGAVISSLSCSGDINYNQLGYTLEDWESIYIYLGNYFINGDESIVEQLLTNCIFPEPSTNF